MAKTTSTKKTPLMLQHHMLKQQHPDAILLFRVGDFYEGFGQDAIDMASILHITLTKRNNESANSESLAGFPYHALDTYLHKLVQAGKRVAICEQLEEPKKAKGIVKRGITEIVTPGVTINEKILDAKTNNYLAAIHQEKEIYGIALADISTGSFYVAQGDVAFIKKTIKSFVPSEMLVAKKELVPFKKNIGDDTYLYAMEDWIFDLSYTKEVVVNHFNIHQSLKGFGMDDLSQATVAAGVILHYLKEIKHPNINHLVQVQRLQQGDHMWLDHFTIANLELVEGDNSLIRILNGTVSPMGSRLLKRWILLPLKDVKGIQQRLSTSSFLFHNETKREEMASRIKHCGDLERLVGKTPTRKINPREVRHIAYALKEIESIKSILCECSCDYLQNLCSTLDACQELSSTIFSTLTEEPPLSIGKGDIIANGQHTELDDLRTLLRSGKESILSMQRHEEKLTGIQKLKVGFNSVFGYYLEVTNSQKSKVPDHWIRRQTLSNCERYITPELKSYEEKVLQAEERAYTLEERLYEALVQKIENYFDLLSKNAKILAEMDCLQGFAERARTNKYVEPKVNTGHTIDLKGCRHPVVEQRLIEEGEAYIPNDILLDRESNQIHIITGPNMSGKSAILRQTALNVLMAHLGSFVACDEAVIPITDKIFTRVGANDNLAKGESTFMVEMHETSSILSSISDRSLVLLDEIGRGTSTYDGISIAWSILEYLAKQPSRPKTLFSTHYHELVQLENQFDQIKNYHISYREHNDQVIFLRKLLPGGSLHSFGIHVARMSGLPMEVLTRAKAILAMLEQKKEHGTLDQVKDLDTQISLKNTGENSSIIQEIKDLDIDRLTPVEALLKLQDIRRRVH